MTRETRIWQRALLALCAATALLWTFDIFGLARIDGALEAFHARAAAPYHLQFLVKPGGPAYRAGIRTGDSVDVRRLSANDRYHLLNRVLNREVLVLPVERGSRTFTAAVTAGPLADSWDAIASFYAGLWTVLLAALLAWRRSDSIPVRIFVLLLALQMFSAALSTTWATPSLPLDVLGNALSALLGTVSGALLALYAAQFARPLSPVRSTLTWLTYACAAVVTAQSVLYIIASWTAVIDPLSPLLWSGPGQAFTGPMLDVMLLVLPLLCAVAAIRAATGSARSQLIWATSAIGMTYVVGIIGIAAGNFESDFFSAHALQIAGNVAGYVTPLGIAYALLNRRLLDIGFVLNRAAVFSGVSLVIVGAFVLVEWALGDWFAHIGHSENIAINACLALILGLSSRAIHKRVDSIVDTVFFRKRHDDEKAIRAFARSAPYITDRAILLERAAQTLELHADASTVTFLLDDERGCYGAASENDPAILALRADGAVVDLHALKTEIAGEFAFPMTARGRLIGALVLGPKRSGDAYAPDETDAILQLAQSTGASLDILAANGVRNPNSIEHITETLRAAVYEAVSEGFERLGQRISS